MTLLFYLAKLLELVFLLIALSILGFGVYQTGASIWYYTRGSVVEGMVSSVREEGGGRFRRTGEMFDDYGDPFQFPTIRYRWPEPNGTIYSIESLVPRWDLSEGDKVTVRVLPSMPAGGRADPSWLAHLFALGAIAFGILMTGALVYLWYGVDSIFGRPVPEGSMSMFAGAAGWILTAIVVVPLLSFLGFLAWYVPWLNPLQIGELFDRGPLVFAEELGGPPTNGPLNEYERSLMRLPFGMATGIASAGFEQALHRGGRNNTRLERYFTAIADPGTPFPLEATDGILRQLIEEESPEMLARFLDTGIPIDDRARAKMLEFLQHRRSRDKEEIRAVLAAHGIGELPPGN